MDFILFLGVFLGRAGDGKKRGDPINNKNLPLY